MKKKTFVALALATGLAALTGCGENPGGSGGGEDSESGEFTLQIFAGGYGTAPWRFALDLFQAEHPEYQVNLNMDNNVNQMFADRWRDGNPPDFVFIDGTLDYPTWLEEGLLEDLSSWKDSAVVPGENVSVKSKVDEAYWRTYTGSDGKTITFGAPLVLNAYGMWYDANLFEEKGWTMPANFNELQGFASLADSSMSTLIYPGVYSGYLTQGMLVPAFAELGDELFSRIMNCSDVDVYGTPEFKGVLTRFNEFINLNDNVVYDCLSLDHTTSQMNWLSHKAAMIPNGLWLRHEMEKDIPEDFLMHFAPSPLNQKQQYLVTTSVTAGIASQAKNKKAAKEFMAYLYRDDVQKQFVYASDSPSPVKLDLANDPKVTEVNKYTQTVFNNPAYKHAANNGSWGGVDAAINNAVNSLVKKSISVDQAIEAIKSAAAAEIKNRA